MAPDDDLLDSIGAGPFEDWIADQRAAEYETRMITELARDPRFRRMVRSAWGLPALVNDALAAVKWES